MEQSASSTIAPSPPRPLVRRLAWTLGAVALFCGTSFVQLPGIGSESRLGYDSDHSITALKLWPFIASFILVEIAALGLPSWRRRRQEQPFRGRMKRAAIILGVLLATYQAFNFATPMDGSQIFESIFSPSLVGSDSPESRVTMMVFLVLGSLACLGMALRITSEGVGNGFAVLWLADLSQHAVARVSRWNWSMVLGDAHVLLALAGVCLILGGVIFVIWRILTVFSRAGDPALVQIPLSGIWPCYLATLVPVLAFGPMVHFLGEDLALNLLLSMRNPFMQQVMQIALIVVIAPVAALFFYWPHRLELRAPENQVRWHSAQFRTLAILVATSAFPPLVHAMFPVTGSWFPDGTTLWVATAILIDLKEEIQARRRAATGVDLLPGPCFHDVLDALREIQARRQVPEAAVSGGSFHEILDAIGKRNERDTSEHRCVQALRFRCLFYIFAPYAPMALLVPSEAAPTTGDASKST